MFHFRSSLQVAFQEFFTSSISGVIYEFPFRNSLRVPFQGFFTSSISGVLYEFHLRSSLQVPFQKFCTSCISGVFLRVPFQEFWGLFHPDLGKFGVLPILLDGNGCAKATDINILDMFVLKCVTEKEKKLL